MRCSNFLFGDNIIFNFAFVSLSLEVEAARLVRPRRTQEPAGTRRRGHCTHNTKTEIEHDDLSKTRRT